MPKLTIGDAEINYSLDDFTDPWGSEPDVVLMHHGYCRSIKFWNSWVPSLARKYKVLRFDVRGCGESSVPPEGHTWSVEQLAKDALNLLDKIAIQKVHWIGESSGGVIGMLFAALYPGRINSLVLCDTPFKLGDKLLSDYSVGEKDPAAGIEKLGLKKWRNQTIGETLDLSKADPRLVQWYISETAKTPEHVAKALIRIFFNADASKLLTKIEAPTLILGGAKSPIVGDQRRVMKERLPNTHFEIFDDIGHGVHLLNPDRCTAAVLRFLDSRI